MTNHSFSGSAAHAPQNNAEYMDGIATGFGSAFSSDETYPSADSLSTILFTRKPALIPVARAHNVAALAESEFANANLPVVNVHAKTRKLQVKRHGLG